MKKEEQNITKEKKNDCRREGKKDNLEFSFQKINLMEFFIFLHIQ